MKAALPLLALSLALAACVPATTAPAPAPAPVARPVPAPARPAPAAPPTVSPNTTWIDAPLTPGAWIYQDFGPGNGKRSLFSDPDNTYYFSLSCATGPDGVQVQFDRTGTPSKRYLEMTIRTETAQRALTGERFGSQMIIAGVPASDPLLDAMALSKGRFAVEVEGEATLILPSYAEVSRVIEDCRG
ncbi:MAG: hypothetical protein EDM03_02720 [Porphyrobacter sp. IPPAS B-1204]|nr:MAG: hypothetical protein EDM03_02720 [Porphyrobacter sp. IPPAS B-1204]